jgi:hypothetical protein
MGRKPGINTSGMKGVSAIIENAHLLALLDGVLTDCTIIVHNTRGSDTGSMMMDLIRRRMNGNRLIEKVLERRSVNHLPDKTGKNGIGSGISSQPIAAEKGTTG